MDFDHSYVGPFRLIMRIRKDAIILNNSNLLGYFMSHNSFKND